MRFVLKINYITNAGRLGFIPLNEEGNLSLLQCREDQLAADVIADFPKDHGTKACAFECDSRIVGRAANRGRVVGDLCDFAEGQAGRHVVDVKIAGDENLRQAGLLDVRHRMNILPALVPSEILLTPLKTDLIMATDYKPLSADCTGL